MARITEYVVAFLCLAAAALVLPPSAAGQETDGEETPIMFSADQLRFDREIGIITASGHVEASRDGRVVLADTVTYNQKTEILTATGNITLLEPTGEVLFAEYMELSGDLKDGIIEDFRMLLTDNSRIAANGARLSGGNITEMSKAVYSPCNLCPDDPTRPPLWQIKAVKVVHDKGKRSIEYTDAWLEIGGVPVAYTPYLSHPDPTVKRRSGFLAPKMGSSSRLGFAIEAPYFFNVAPNIDLTITPIYTSKEGPVLVGEYRHLLGFGELQLEASITEDSRNDMRGHVNGFGRFDIDETWRTGFDVVRASDDTYMRRYGLGGGNTLTSRVFAEGFRGRNYLSVDALTFQGLHEYDRQGKTPIILPVFDFHHVGEADGLGGRTDFDVNFLNLVRTNGTDSRRLSTKVGWRLPFIGPLGDVYAFSTSLRGDIYHVDDVARGGNRGDYTGYEWRLLPQASLEWRFPFVSNEGPIQQIVEPIASATISPNGGNPSNIPNEDSVDFEFDDTNLFSPNRFTGLDRVEGGARISYGLKWGAYGRGGGSTTVLVGQTFRPRTDDTFAMGSGVEDNFSDFVARVSISPTSYLDLLYRSRFDKDDLDIRRNEIDFSIGPPALKLTTDYVFFDSQPNTEFGSREEIRVGISSQLSRFWRGQLGVVQDLTDDGGLRNIALTFFYEDECFILSTNISRTYYRDRDVEPNDAVMLRLTFKTLGETEARLK